MASACIFTKAHYHQVYPRPQGPRQWRPYRLRRPRIPPHKFRRSNPTFLHPPSTVAAKACGAATFQDDKVHRPRGASRRGGETWRQLEICRYGGERSREGRPEGPSAESQGSGHEARRCCWHVEGHNEFPQAEISGVLGNECSLFASPIQYIAFSFSLPAFLGCS